mmetsp:Transcript_7622/g.9948  ORF Transcript_7622/g.9948 Transcript_7622/m.9948 type:complete len:376 (+) Transcript_7622:343-1470(+)
MSSILKDGRLPKSVLVVSKGTRWEYLRGQLLASTQLQQIKARKYDTDHEKVDRDLKESLISRGLPFERILTSHETHHKSLNGIVNGIQNSWSSNVRVVKAHELELADLERVDAVFTAGGDGTVLETALWIHMDTLPVIAVNTDPVLSSGFLCSYKYNESSSIEKELLEPLKFGAFSWLMRARIDLSIDDKNQLDAMLRVPRFALNEMFFAEADASRPTVHETTTPHSGTLVQRSSGVIVSTGTGSTAWMSSASMVSKPDINRILSAAGLHLSDEGLDRVTTRVNSDCVYSPSSTELQYFVREPVMNGWYGRHDEPLSVSPRRGFTDTIKIKSLGWGQTKLTVDGLRSFTVPYGSTVTAKIAPKANWLRTIVLQQN